jgi:muramoyltetrapeptide carboxypeptidase LdcA involved in peptidoglycan recycling
MNKDLLRSYRLQKGDKIAVLAPSSGLAERFLSVYKQGLKNLKEVFGLTIKEYPSARMSNDYLHHHPETRAEDVNSAFADDEVKGIITTIGGDDSVRILPFLDSAIIQRNPKLFMGYSDATVLLVYLHSLGLIPFHGPSVMAGFAQTQYLPQTFQDHVNSFLFSEFEEYEYAAYSAYCDGYLDWDGDGSSGKTAPLQKHDGWRWIGGAGKVVGELFGGCIEALEFLKSTKYWPKEIFWTNKVFFLETSEEKPSVNQVKYMLRNYGTQGVFQKISALFFGRANHYSNEEKAELEAMILRVVVGEFGAEHLPIITNMDFGHTDPQFILPLGVPVEVSCEGQTVKLLPGRPFTRFKHAVVA